MYIGKPYQSTAVPSKTFDTFTGNGSTTTLTLSQTPSSVNNVFVYFDGVAQRPTTDYTLAGNTLTFSSAPSNGVVVFAIVGGGEHISTPMGGSIEAEDIVDGSITNAKITSVDASKLSGSAFPVINGANISNQFEQTSPFTESTSDPAADSNLGLGAAWVNTTTGTIYICKDATNNMNVWQGVGDGSGHILKNQLPGEATDDVPNIEENTTLSHTFTGGTDADGTVTHYVVDQISDPILSVAVSEVAAGSAHDFTASGVSGDTNVTFRVRTKDNAGMYSPGITVTVTVTDFVPFWSNYAQMHAYSAGGYNGNDKIERFSVLTDANNTEIGTLATQVEYASGTNSISHGYIYGGIPQSWSGSRSEVQKVQLSASASASNVSSLVKHSYQLGVANEENYGWKFGGDSIPDPDWRILEKQSYASDSNMTSPGNMVGGDRGTVCDGVSGTTHGFSIAGNYYMCIDKWSYASGTDAADHGNSSGYRTGAGTQWTTTHGYLSGGYRIGVGAQKHIDKFSFASNTTASQVGEISSWRYGNLQGWSTQTHAYTGTGYGGYTTVDKFAFASEGTASHCSDLLNNTVGGASFQR